MKRGEGFIDWNTAEIAITSNPQSNTLTVEIAGDLGTHWRIEFQNMAKIHNQGQERSPRPWGNVSLVGGEGSMSKTEIQVDEVKPGAESDLKEQLDHFAKLASKAAAPKEEQDAQRSAERQIKAQERSNQAAEMQKRFRAA
jgi:hypothetical protein